MVVQHNLLAGNANRMNGINTGKRAKLTEKLSSGYRINRAADDAAGLSISEKMRRQIRGLTQASANAQDGISLVQIADGAMNEVHEMLHRGTELSVKAANETLTEVDREYIQAEIEQLVEEIDSISDRTDFNGIQVLKGKDVPYEESSGEVIISGGLPDWIKIDAATEAGKHMDSVHTTWENFEDGGITTLVEITHEAATLDFSQFTGSAAQLDELEGQGFYTTCCTCQNHYSIRFTKDTTSSMKQSGDHFIYSIGIGNVTNVDDLLNAIVDGTEGGNPNRHYTKIEADLTNKKLIIYDDRSNTSNPKNGNTTGKWTGWDHPQFNTTAGGNYGKFGPGTAYAKEDAGALVAPSEIAIQIGAEAGQHLKMELPSISSITLGVKWVDVSTVDGASDAITTFKNAVGYVSKERSRMGAYQNRLEHTIKNLDNVVENTQAAESLIRDTNMADLMVEYANQNILLQASQSMLAQANQVNQGVLSLLG